MLTLPFVPPPIRSLVEMMTARPGTIARILHIAIREWGYFGGERIEHGKTVHQGHSEHKKGYYQRVGEYRKVGTGLSYDGRDRNQAWSSAFISYVMREAGVSDSDFKGTQRHSEYIYAAIQNRLTMVPDAKFLGWRLSEYKPKVGDIVCYHRGHVKTFEQAAKQSKYKAHGDIVVFVRSGEIGVIGGNVGDSVALKTLKIDGSGTLTDKTHSWFCILENRLPWS